MRFLPTDPNFARGRSQYKMVKGLGVLEDLASLRHLVFLLLMCGLSCAVPLHSGGPSVVLSPDVRGPQAVKSSVVALPMIT